jgi:hypothetical protein
LKKADALVGGEDAFLIVDDTALPKKGKRSVGVASQYASSLGKNANCQTLVSLTLARGEVPVMVGLRLFLPESWTSDLARMRRAKVPADRAQILSVQSAGRHAPQDTGGNHQGTLGLRTGASAAKGRARPRSL